METSQVIGLLMGLGIFSGVCTILYVMTKLRKVVPTNQVVIVQKGKRTISYGAKLPAGAVFYQIPQWVPGFGVTSRVLSVNNFSIELKNYAAFDVNKVPFCVDVKAFFRIINTDTAAQRVESQEALEVQLKAIVEDAVRTTLAKSELEKVMQERNQYAKWFTEAVEGVVSEWGCQAIKTIALMDIKDALDDTGRSMGVITNIMAKKKSEIEMKSKVEIAENTKLAITAELEAKKEIDTKRADTDRQAGEAKARAEFAVGVADAESKKKVGLAMQIAEQEIADQKKVTEEKNMEVLSVSTVRKAEIEKEALLIQENANKEALLLKTEAMKKQQELSADAKKYETEQLATAKLVSEQNNAKAIEAVAKANAIGIKEKGLAEAVAEKEMGLSRVAAEIALAEKIGESVGYQDYLVRIKTVELNAEVSKAVGVANAQALEAGLHKADVKIIANAENSAAGIQSVGELISSKGGMALGSMIEGLKNTPVAGKLLEGFIGSDGDKG